MTFEAGRLIAQTQPADSLRNDSVKIYRLGEVVIQGSKITTVTPTSVEKLSLATIDRTDAVSAEALAYQIPAARVQTNSRGESLIYLRNSGERQTALFYDGALLNVPWDNRLDLSLVPLSAVGGVTVSRGPTPVLYGANVMGGAINMVTQELALPGYLTEINLQGGQYGFYNASLTHMGNLEDINYLISLGRTGRDGLPVPADADLPFNQDDSDIRTNSDNKITSLFVRGEKRFSIGNAVGLSVNLMESEKGVMPEGNTDDPRLWRLPVWRNLTVTLNGEARFDEEGYWGMNGAVWGTMFEQEIAQYRSTAFETLAQRQLDDDATFGTRLVFRREFDSSTLRLAVNALTSTHEQQEPQYDENGIFIPYEDDGGNEAPYPIMEYQQHIYSVGLDYEARLTSMVGVQIGAGIDGMTTPKTGDKPSLDPLTDYGFTAGMIYQVTPDVDVRASAGRKTRFPTMRELYGEALGRFLLNPDLKPEDAWLGEIAMEGTYHWGHFGVIPFGSFTNNTIDQRRFDTLGGQKRQRINLPGSRVFGVELSGGLRSLRPFRIDAHFTYMYARGLVTASDGSDSTIFLTEKPEILGTLTASYDFPFGLRAQVEAVHTGRAYTPSDDDFVELPAATTLNARVSYKMLGSLTEHFSWEIFVRGDNLTDAVVLPQLGLPAPGRQIQGGVKLTL